MVHLAQNFEGSSPCHEILFSLVRALQLCHIVKETYLYEKAYVSEQVVKR